MSLLDDASLLVTPNARKEGKLYSIIPTNGNGDFSVTRATTATRVNAAGLVELVPYNLMTYSEMFTNAAWVKTATNITANTTTAPNGTLTADTLTADGTSSFHQAAQLVPATSGMTYTFSVYAKKNTNNFIQLIPQGAIGGTNFWANFDLNSGVVGSTGSLTTAAITSVGNGWYRCSITGAAVATTTGTFSVLIASSATAARGEVNTLTTSVFAWGAQFVEGTSALDYQMTETRLNIPRLDYSLGSCPNILLEPQRTNLALRSEEFDNASWTKTAVSVAANSTISPSGLSNADTMTGDGTSNQHFVSQTNSFTLGVSYTLSVYLKKGTNNFAQLYAFSTIGGMFANFDLNNGVVGTLGTTTGSNPTSSITSVGNGWYRCAITFVPTITSVSGFAIMPVTSASAARAETNTLSTSVFLWGAQLEAGAYPTSYIPTTSASVTRNIDVVQKTGVSSLIGQTQGTLYGQLHIGASDSSSTVRMIASLSNGTVNNRIEIYRFNNTIQYDNVVGGAIQFSGSVATITSFNTTMRIAIKYSLNSVKFFINGVLVNTDTTALIPACSQINIGTNYAGSVAFGGFINSMALFPTPLTDTQCIALTT